MKRFLFLSVAILLCVTVNAQQKNNIPIGEAGTIRGNGVLSKTPLIILDGKIIDSSISELDPNKISSFSILKGASAIALYGIEAENGVIVITSKKPIETTTVTPGDGTRVILRGTSTIGKSPLYVVDGEILEAGYILGLDPNKIESLHILKSTSAVAQYGPTALQGVVVITTKKNTPQQTKK